MSIIYVSVSHSVFLDTSSHKFDITWLQMKKVEKKNKNIEIHLKALTCRC